MYNVKDYGATGNGKKVFNAYISGVNLSVLTQLFSPADVGKFVDIKGAGISGQYLNAIIIGFQNASTVTISVSASTTISSSTPTELRFGTDDTYAIQAAINDCFNKGGGTVYFPNGIYFLNSPPVSSTFQGSAINPNSQLYIPYDIFDYTDQASTAATNKRSSITLLGETIYNGAPVQYVATGQSRYDNVRMSNAGAILESTHHPSLQSNVSMPMSILGTIGPADTNTPPNPYINNVNLGTCHCENLTLITSIYHNYHAPAMSGINMRYIKKFSAKNVLIGSDSIAINLETPSSYTTGIFMPQIYCEPQNLITNVTVVGGFAYGIYGGEHTHVISALIENCQHAYVAGEAVHPHYLHYLIVQACIYCISANTGGFLLPYVSPYRANIKVNLLAIETETYAANPSLDYQHAINDPNNLLHGNCIYTIVSGPEVGKTFTSLGSAYFISTSLI